MNKALSTNWPINYGVGFFKKVCKQVQSTVDQREYLLTNHAASDLPVIKQCELLGVSRSSFYYEPKLVDETHICGLIHQICGEDQSKGYRMITADLRVYHNMTVNSKRVRRVMAKLKIMGILPKRNLSKNKRPEYKYPYLLKLLLVGQANMVWCTDITYSAPGLNR